MNLLQARQNMIEQQVRPWEVLDQRVLDVLASVPREAYLDPKWRGLAYSDTVLPIGYGQVMFKPVVEGRMLQALDVDLTETVLEVGTGSGYLTTCLARLGSHCDSVEIIPALAHEAAARLNDAGVANVNVMTQDASEPWDARDAYDAIVFGGAVRAIPEWFKHKLALDGRLFAVVGEPSAPTMEAILLTRVDEQEWLRESLFEVHIEPLLNFGEVPTVFQF